MKDGFVRIAAATPSIRVADCRHNADQVLTIAREAAAAGVSLLVFPALCLTGATCGDLFWQDALLARARAELLRVAAHSATLDLMLVVGLPIAADGRIYNVAAVLHRGRILGLVPQAEGATRGAGGEAWRFDRAPFPASLSVDGAEVLFGTDLLFACTTLPQLVLGIELGADMTAPVPPASLAAVAGATVIAQLAASREQVGQPARRHLLLGAQSTRLACTVVHAAAGTGESTTDGVFAGHNLIYENGRLLAESRRFATGWIRAETDLELLVAQRRRRESWPATAPAKRRIPFALAVDDLQLERAFAPHPFVPAAAAARAARCEEILAIQAAGLAKRLAHTGATTAVLGLSGGLDSTLALIVAMRAFDQLERDRAGIVAVTMPGFGTTERTYGNATALARHVGATLREIPIVAAVEAHFRDIGHDPDVHDVTYENAQARERAQILMDVANQTGGLVVGTGDLSELALGWTTYNGDHMSMYGVNAAVPKTLVRPLVRHAAAACDGNLRAVLTDIADTPVSPELLPPDADGQTTQITEELVGPYELHDFFLYHLLRNGFAPAKIGRLAGQAFAGVYTAATIQRVLTVFIRRFFSQQFKRSCLPDGPQVGSVALSPRGDWQMPSDAIAALWLDDLMPEA